MREVHFYVCKHCGNVVEMIRESGVPVVCCGEKMTYIAPNTVEAAHEKHLPAVTISGDTVHVSVGTVTHPMQDAHYIEWIYMITKKGAQCRLLHPGDAPQATFVLADGDKAESVYSYCNLHGLWRTVVE